MAVTLAVSTYAYVWRRHPDLPHPMTVLDVLDDAARLQVDGVQICDVGDLEDAVLADDGIEWLDRVRQHAEGLGLFVEMGTRGVEPDHLARHLNGATRLGARLVRSMIASVRGTPTLDEALEWLRQAIPAYEAAGVTLGLETYEQVATPDLVRLVDAVGSPNLGIVLDPGNCVARLEHPLDVIGLSAPHCVNLHVKDFAFTRREGTVGFTYAGAPLGTGLLDHPAEMSALAEHGREVTQVIEHWLTRQDATGDRTSIEQTCEVEAQWVADSVAWLRARGV